MDREEFPTCRIHGRVYRDIRRSIPDNGKARKLLSIQFACNQSWREDEALCRHAWHGIASMPSPPPLRSSAPLATRAQLLAPKYLVESFTSPLSRCLDSRDGLGKLPRIHYILGIWREFPIFDIVCQLRSQGLATTSVGALNNILFFSPKICKPVSAEIEDLDAGTKWDLVMEDHHFPDSHFVTWSAVKLCPSGSRGWCSLKLHVKEAANVHCSLPVLTFVCLYNFGVSRGSWCLYWVLLQIPRAKHALGNSRTMSCLLIKIIDSSHVSFLFIARSRLWMLILGRFCSSIPTTEERNSFGILSGPSISTCAGHKSFSVLSSRSRQL